MDAIRSDIALSEFPLTGKFLAGRMREQLTADDKLRIEGLIDTVIDRGDGTRLVESGERLGSSTILIDGFVLRTVDSDGKRFVVGINVPGDFIDLHGFALKRLDHHLVAAGDVTIGCVSHDKLAETFAAHASLARAAWFSTLLDAAIHRKWIQILEQLDAPRRIAHLYAEIHTRLGLVGQEAQGTLRTPFTQLDLADMCGVSAIHANRAVGRLREMGIAEIRRGDLHTDDWEQLKRFAQFDPAYLYGTGA